MADKRQPETSTVRESLTVVRAVVDIIDSRPAPHVIVERVGEVMEAAKNLRPHMVDDVLDHLRDRYPGMAEERRARADALARRIRGDEGEDDSPPLAEDQKPDPERSPPDVDPGDEPDEDEGDPDGGEPPVEVASADEGIEPLWEQGAE